MDGLVFLDEVWVGRSGQPKRPFRRPQKDAQTTAPPIFFDGEGAFFLRFHIDSMEFLTQLLEMLPAGAARLQNAPDARIRQDLAFDMLVLGLLYASLDVALSMRREIFPCSLPNSSEKEINFTWFY